MTAFASNLRLAIELRVKTREALDRDDMPAVCVLNRAADAAYAKLTPVEAGVYQAWVWEGLDKSEFIGARGDA